MRIKLDYGRTGLEVELPDDRVVGPLAIKPTARLEDPQGVLRQRLEHPIGTPPLAELAQDLNAGAVEVLVIVGGNPVFTAPADLDFSDLVQKAKFSAHLSMYNDETSAFCQWHVPEAHYLESWSDARAADGTITIVQPLIEPLYNGKTAHELLAAFTDQPERTGYDLIREHWNRRHGAGTESFDAEAEARQGYGFVEKQCHRIDRHLDHGRDQHQLAADPVLRPRSLQPLVDEPLVSRVLIHDDDPVLRLGQDIRLVELGASGAERGFGRLS